VPSAGAWVGGEDEQEACGHAHHSGGSCDDDVSGFQGLPHGVEDSCAAFGGFVEEEDSVVGHGYGAGSWEAGAASDE
jgi:hypothetical protein